MVPSATLCRAMSRGMSPSIGESDRHMAYMVTKYACSQ